MVFNLSHSHNNSTHSLSPSPSPPLRIADILLINQDHQDEFEEEQVLMGSCREFECLSPQRIVARLFSGLMKRREKGKSKREEEKVVGDDNINRSMHIRSPSSSMNEFNSGSSLNLVSENHVSGKETLS